MKKNSAASEIVTRSFLRSELDDLKKEIDRKAQGYRDQILTKLDETMGELGAMREENTIDSGQTSQLRDTVQDHEKRIKKIEKIQQTP